MRRCHARGTGGDIKLVRSTDGLTWSPPKVVLSQLSQGNVPKVIANRPVALDDGHILLPFWREDPAPISYKCLLAASCQECKPAKDAPVRCSGGAGRAALKQSSRKVKINSFGIHLRCRNRFL